MGATWKTEFINDLSQKSSAYYLTIVRTPRSTAPILYEMVGADIQHCNELDRDLLRKYMDYFTTLKLSGVYVLKYEKGADLNKISLAERPLEIAFTNSPKIVWYIYENYREIFDKEVKAKGFRLAAHTKDVGLLELLKNCGCDMECEGASFPPLHNFADYNNTVAIQYFADQGANLNVLNVHKQTALDRARNNGNEEAIALLEKLTTS